MHRAFRVIITGLLLLGGCGANGNSPSAAALAAQVAPPVPYLLADSRHGQTFLTWPERDTTGIRFEVLGARQPITEANRGQATTLARIATHTAIDWYLDPEFSGHHLPEGRAKPAPVGWRITEGGPRLNPSGGLFVHTVTPETAGEYYFAVVAVDEASGAPKETVQPGVNSLTAPVSQLVAPVEPIWQGDGPRPEPGAGRDLPLDLQIHAKSGSAPQEWLTFGTADQGWRDGLPYKFAAGVANGGVLLRPSDQTWIGRILTEARDPGNALIPSIWTFWYGYNSRIDDPAAMAEGVATNYTERRLLWLLEWTKRSFGTDPNRTYCTGSSMGGCGTISFAYRHPEIFAAVAAMVPVVVYDKGSGGDSARRIEGYCGPLDALCSDGVTLRERLDGTQFVSQHHGDLPYLVITNGRKDGSIPWWKNPDFYRAVVAARQGFTAAWNEGDHGTAGKLMPTDIAERHRYTWLHRFALNQSFVALSNCSADDDPGNGHYADGDPAGFINRGLDWQVTADQPDRYEVLVTWSLPAGELPVTVDVTPRRVQGLSLTPGLRLTAVLTDVATGHEVGRQPVTVDDDGQATVTSVRIATPAGTRITLQP